MSTAIVAGKPSTKPEAPDARQSTRQSKRRPDCRAATNKSHSVKIPLAISSDHDNHQPAATANMALPCAEKFSSRLSRHSRQAPFFGLFRREAHVLEIMLVEEIGGTIRTSRPRQR